MNHTSGLVRYEFKPKFTADLTRESRQASGSRRSWLAYLLDAEAAVRARAQGWDYSDTNYIVLGMIIEQGHRHARTTTQVRERVLEPLRLTDDRAADARAIRWPRAGLRRARTTRSAAPTR